MITADISQDAMALKQFTLEPESVLYLANAVSKAKFIYRTICTNISESDSTHIEQLVKRPFLKTLKMSTANSNLLATPQHLGSIGWHQWYKSLMLKRMEIISRLIGGKNALGQLLRNSMRRHLLTNTSQPSPNTLSTDHSPKIPLTTINAQNSWLSTTITWANEHDLTLHEPSTPDKHHHTDIKIVDLAKSQSDLKTLAKGCVQHERYFLSQIIDPYGKYIPSAGRTIHKNGIKISNETTRKFQAKIRELLTARDPSLFQIGKHTPTPPGNVEEFDTVIRKVNDPTTDHQDHTQYRASVIEYVTKDECFGYDLVESTTLNENSNNKSAYVANTDGSLGGFTVECVSKTGSVCEIKMPTTKHVTDKIQTSKLLHTIPNALSSNITIPKYTDSKQDYRTGILYDMIHNGPLKSWPKQSCTRIASLLTQNDNQAHYTLLYDKQDDFFNTNSSSTDTNGAKTPTSSLINTLQQNKHAYTYGHLCDLNPEITERNWTINDNSEYDFEVGSDGSVKADRGTFGWIASGKNTFLAGGGETTSSYNLTHSFRTESAGILSAMTHLWDDSSPNRKVRLVTDNLSASDIFNNKCKSDKSTDIWDQIAWWKNVWKDNFTVTWKRGHPEKREKDTTKWSDDDWRNHGADRICDLMYYTGKTMNSKNLPYHSNWYWALNGERISDSNIQTLEEVASETSLQYLCKCANIPINEINWLHTGRTLNLKHRPLRSKKGILNRIFDRAYLHSNMLRKGLYGKLPTHIQKDTYSPVALNWIQSNNKSHCQSCNDNLSETREHFLAVCSNKKAVDTRSKWHKKVLTYAEENLPPLHSLLHQHLKITTDKKITWKGSTHMASLILAGCIPSEWWTYIVKETAKDFDDIPSVEQREEMDRTVNNYNDFLKWYGANIGKHLWSPLYAIRSEKYNKREPDDDEEDETHISSVSHIMDPILYDQATHQSTIAMNDLPL